MAADIVKTFTPEGAGKNVDVRLRSRIKPGQPEGGSIVEYYTEVGLTFNDGKASAAAVVMLAEMTSEGADALTSAYLELRTLALAKVTGDDIQ